MMDALQEARKYMEVYDATQGNTLNLGPAQAYAAIAQAEQLKRIGDYLENMSGAYTATTFGYYPQGVANPEDDIPAGSTGQAEASFDELKTHYDYGISDPSHYVQTLDD